MKLNLPQNLANRLSDRQVNALVRQLLEALQIDDVHDLDILWSEVRSVAYQLLSKPDGR